MTSRIVVSIDGGGIRGILPLIFLKEIQQHLVRDFYNLDVSWWGTSTGALISGALSVQKGIPFNEAVQKVLDIYEFRSSSAIQPHGAALPARALNQLIQTNFGEMDLTAQPNLNLVVSRLETHEPHIFNHKNSCKVGKAIQASCAFPGVFPAVEIQGEYFVDGFFNAKNPTELAVEHELPYTEKLIVISLGTGVMREEDAIEQMVNHVDEKMRGLANDGDITYYRFNPKLIHSADSMQNTSPKNVLNLRRDAKLGLEWYEDPLKDLVQLLNDLD